MLDLRRRQFLTLTTYPDQGLNDTCSYSSFDQCYQTILGRGGFCRPNPFPGTPYGTGYTWSGPMR
jgi:hypothetical protein